MDINIKKNNGITLTMLVITVLVLAILSGVTVTVAKGSVTQSKKYNFSSELEIVQQKIRIVSKEIELGSEAYIGIGTKYEDLDATKKQKVGQILDQNGVTDYTKYVYMSKGDLLEIGLKNINQNVIISYENSVVYSYDGIKINGVTYYSIDELSK